MGGVCLVIAGTVGPMVLVGDCYLLARVAPDNNEGGKSDDEGNKSEGIHDGLRIKK